MKVHKTVLISTFLSFVFLLAFLTAFFLFSAKKPSALPPLESIATTSSSLKFPQGLNGLSISNLKPCIIKAEERIVRGNSLAGLIEPGQTVKILLGFYDCDEIKREDIVLYNYAGNSNPLIKIVKGVSSDKFGLQKTSGGWHILINGEIVRNSQNQPYVFDEGGYKMLSLYEKDYAGVIPKNAYLILGNLASGSLDSTHFGLIDKSDILGKVDF